MRYRLLFSNTLSNFIHTQYYKDIDDLIHFCNTYTVKIIKIQIKFIK